MAIKTILVAASGTEQSRSTLDVGLMVAAHLKSHVDIIHVKVDPLAALPALGDSMTTQIADEITGTLSKEASQRAETAKLLFEACCKDQKIPVVTETPPVGEASASWIEQVGRPDIIVSRRARTADLLVVGKPTFKAKLQTSGTAQAGLLETGRPVLVAPSETPTTIGKRIAIAWNGSAEASRAVAAATNFFGGADKITVLTAESERTPAAVAQQLADYLACHGIEAETKIFARMGGQHLGGKALLQACEEIDADLLVMGAFVAAGMRELILGNATQHVLSHAKLPVLMGH